MSINIPGCATPIDSLLRAASAGKAGYNLTSDELTASRWFRGQSAFDQLSVLAELYDELGSYDRRFLPPVVALMCEEHARAAWERYVEEIADLPTYDLPTGVDNRTGRPSVIFNHPLHGWLKIPWGYSTDVTREDLEVVGEVRRLSGKEVAIVKLADLVRA